MQNDNSNMDRYSIILVGTEDERNIGFTARVMANFGLSSLILVSPQCKITETAYILARHASSILDNVTIYDTLNQLAQHFNVLIGTTARVSYNSNTRRLAYNLRDFLPLIADYDGKIGFVFGRESSGLTNNEIDHLDFIVTIPTSPSYPALNLSHAVGIIAYELFVNTKTKSKGFKLADSKHKEILFDYVNHILTLIEYPNFKKKILIRTLKNLLGRSLISMRELYALLGFFRRIKYHLQSC